MSDHDRSARLNAAAELLFLLKSYGTTQRFVAAYLGISHAKLSRWNRAEEDSDRRSGAPSKEQLVKLVALVRYQFSASIQDAFESLEGLRFQPVGEHLWYALESFEDELTSRRAEAKARRDKLDAATSKIATAIGMREARELLKPEIVETCFPDAGDPSPSMQVAHARAAAAAARELEASQVTSEDAMKARLALDQWCKAHDAKIRERRHRKRRGQSSGDPGTG